jgi:hypothetical protein
MVRGFPEEWIANLINDLPPIRSEGRPKTWAEGSTPPSALVVDCGTGETKIVAYSFEQNIVSARLIAKFAPATTVLDDPDQFVQSIRKLVKAESASFVLVSASAWMRKADQETLSKGYEILQNLSEKGVICKILAEREEAWFELAAVEFISSLLPIKINGSWAAGGGSTQISSEFNDVHTIPIGNEEGKKIILEQGLDGLKKWREHVKQNFSSRRLAIKGNIICISAVYYAAMAVGLPELKVVSRNEIIRRFENYLSTMTSDQLRIPSIARDVANIAQQLEVLSVAFIDSTRFIFARNFEFEGKTYSLTWSCGWYLHLLKEAQIPMIENKSLRRFSDENAYYENLASAVLGSSITVLSKASAGHLIATLGQVADWLISSANSSEPEITQSLKLEVAKYNVHLEGLPNRIKSRQSLQEKLHRKLSVLLMRNQLNALYLPRVSDVLFEVNDVIRYSIVIQEDAYSSVALEIINSLKNKYRAGVTIHNFWAKNTTFCAVNVYISKIPVPFEIQFHTPQSVQTKNKTSHGVYSALRKLEPSAGKLVLYKQLVEEWRSVRVPPGIEGLGTPAPMLDAMMEQMLIIDRVSEGKRSLNPAMLCFRLVRGRDDKEFEFLAYPPEEKRLAWVSSSSNFNEIFSSLTQQDSVAFCEIAKIMGKSAIWVRDKIRDGYKWKLIVMPQYQCTLADWTGCLMMVQRSYPEVASKIARFRKELLTTPFEDIERDLGNETFRSIKDAGRSSPKYIDLVRLHDEDSPTLWQIRAFLYNVVGVNEFFLGTGHKSDAEGRAEEYEYLTLNRAVSEIPGFRVFDIKTIERYSVGFVLMLTCSPKWSNFSRSPLQRGGGANEAPQGQR